MFMVIESYINKQKHQPNPLVRVKMFREEDIIVLDDVMVYTRDK